MNKKTIMTMLVAGALSVSALSTAAVFAENANVNGNNAAVTETISSKPTANLLTSTWTGKNDIVFEVDTKGQEVGLNNLEVYDSNGNGITYINSTIQPKIEVDESGKGKVIITSDALKNAKYSYADQGLVSIDDWSKIDTVAIDLYFKSGDNFEYVPTWHLVADVEDSETTTPAAYEPEITLTTPKWTGDSDIVFEVDAKGGTVYHFEVYVYDANDAGYPIFVQSKVEVNQEGKGKITFTKDALKNAKIWADGDDEPQIAIDWTKYSEIEFAFDFELNGQHKYRSMFVETSVKAPEVTVTPTTPAKPSTPAKPTENKGTTTITPNASVAKDDKKTNTTTTTKKEAPKTGDTMNVALYASLLLVSALAAVVLTTKKRITE